MGMQTIIFVSCLLATSIQMDSAENRCMFNCQEKCFEAYLNIDSGLKCLEQCAPLWIGASSPIKKEYKGNPIQLIIQKWSQCHSACKRSCILSYRNLNDYNRKPTVRKCENECQEKPIVTPDPITMDPDSCIKSCSTSCQQSYSPQPRQNMVVDKRSSKCQRKCNRICNASRSKLQQTLQLIRTPIIFVPDKLTNVNASKVWKQKSLGDLLQNKNFINCSNHSNFHSNNCGKGYLRAFHVIKKKRNVSQICQANCSNPCTEYCEMQKPRKPELCASSKCKQPCPFTRNANTINVFGKKETEPNSELRSNRLKDKDSVPETTALEEYLFARHNDNVSSQEKSKRKSNLYTTINVFPHNFTAILDCQIRCVKYCTEHYRGNDCISGCQRACLEGAIQEAKEKTLVTTLSIGELKKEEKKPQILPCNLGAKPTGENCDCPKEYTQCGVNQCCRR